MKISMPRGEHAALIGEQNREAIFLFFQENPGASLTDAMRNLGLSYVTIHKHARAIRDGWKPRK